MYNKMIWFIQTNQPLIYFFFIPGVNNVPVQLLPCGNADGFKKKLDQLI